MGQYDDEYEDDFEQDEQGQSEGPKALRDALKKAQKQNADLVKKLADLETAQKESTLNGLLSERKVNPKVVKYLKADGVEATAEAVDGWLKENADVFNIQTEGTQEEPEAEAKETEQPEPEQDPAIAAVLAQMQSVQQVEAEGASSPDSDDLTDTFDAIGQNAKGFNDAIEALKKLGMRVGNGG